MRLSLFKKADKPISWVSQDKEGISLVIMPKWVKEVLKEQVFSRKMPIVFSSATLSVNGSFDYMMEILGMESALSFSVPSPYDYEQQMTVSIPKADHLMGLNDKVGETYRLLKQSAEGHLFYSLQWSNWSSSRLNRISMLIDRPIPSCMKAQAKLAI